MSRELIPPCVGQRAHRPRYPAPDTLEFRPKYGPDIPVSTNKAGRGRCPGANCRSRLLAHLHMWMAKRYLRPALV